MVLLTYQVYRIVEDSCFVMRISIVHTSRCCILTARFSINIAIRSQFIYHRTRRIIISRTTRIDYCIRITIIILTTHRTRGSSRIIPQSRSDGSLDLGNAHPIS